MTTLTIPAEAWSLIGDEPTLLAVVEGEGAWVHHADGCPSGDCVYGSAPPADLRAAVDAECPDCEGHGYVEARNVMHGWERCPNPRCHEGRLTIDVRVALADDMAVNEPHHNCPHCGGFCALYEAMWGGPCEYCDGTGVVSHPVLVTGVWPIVAMDQHNTVGTYLVLGNRGGGLYLVSNVDFPVTSEEIDPALVAAHEQTSGPRDTWPGRYHAVIGRRAS